MTGDFKQCLAAAFGCGLVAVLMEFSPYPDTDPLDILWMGLLSCGFAALAYRARPK